MKGQLWRFKLYYSFCDVLFNKYEILDELYIPELNHSINMMDGEYNIIQPSRDRYKNQNIFSQKVVIEFINNVEIEKKDLIKLKKMIKQKKLN
jgi:hypothetical protein